MKRYAYISIWLIILLLFCSSCRSNRTLSETSQKSTNEQTSEKQTSSSETDSTSTTLMDQIVVEDTSSGEQTVSASAKERDTDEYSERDTTVDIYDEYGNLRASIRSNQRSGRSDRNNERTGSLRVSGQSNHTEGRTRVENNATISSSQLTDIDNKISSNSSLNEQKNEDADADSRPVQGVEWFWITLPIVVVLAILIGVLFYKYKKSKQ